MKRFITSAVLVLTACAGTPAGKPASNDRAASLVEVAKRIAQGDALAVVQQKTLSLGTPDAETEDYCTAAGCVYDVRAGVSTHRNVTWYRPNDSGEPDLALFVRFKHCPPASDEWLVTTVEVSVGPHPARKRGFSRPDETGGYYSSPDDIYTRRFEYAQCGG